MTKQLKLPTLLIVSENPTVRFWVKKHFDEKFFIIQAEKKEEAISALSAALDFIIIDDAIESYDPLELCETLHSLTQKNLTPILLVTGKLKKAYRDEAKKHGVTNFLSDQLEIEELQARIDEGLKGASIRQKTENLIQSIHPNTPTTSNHSLQKKIILNDKAVRLFALAKKMNTPTSSLTVRIDSFDHSKDKEKNELWEFFNDLLRDQDALLTLPEGFFTLLLANTNKQSGKIIAERLIKKVKTDLNFTISIVLDELLPNEKEFHQKIESAKKTLLENQTSSELFENNAT